VGQVGQLGRSFTWSLNRGSSGIRSIEVSVAVRNGRTRIMAQENLGQLIGVTFGAIGGGVGAGGIGPVIAMMTQGFHTDPVALAIVIPAWLLTVLATARSVYYHSVKRRSRTLEELVDRLAALCRDLIEESRPRLPAGRGKADGST
jgi:hypothetical protein